MSDVRTLIDDVTPPGVDVVPTFGKTPVLVFGSSLTGLGVVRSLGRAKIPAYTFCPASECMVRSRWYKTLPEAGGRCPSIAELPAFLAGLSLPGAVLMPCSDDWLTAVCQLPRQLQNRFPASCSSPSAIETFVDKWQFARMLQGLGVPHPRTALLQSMDEMLAVPASQYEGSFLKPLGSLEFGRRHNVKAFLIKNKEDAVVRMTPQQGAKSDFPILLQEYIPGPPANHYFIDGFVDRHHTVRALFARKRLRMYPPWLGNSTLMETVSIGKVEGAVDTIRKIVAAMSYRGIFSAEFKYDDRDGLFKIIEVNARPWWFIEFATRCGVDVCQLAYRDALQMPVESIDTYDVGRRCVYVLNDFRAYREQNPGGSTVGWVRSVFGADEALFCLDDHRPAVFSFSEVLKLHLRRKEVRR